MKMLRSGNKGFTIGELIVVFAIVIIVAVLMQPFVKYSQERTDKILCANNLRELGLAIYIFARENGGEFPPSIKALYDKEYLADERLVDCPANKEVGTPEDPDYLYTAGLSIKAPSMESLLRDKKDNHPQGGRHILYVNGKVVWKHGHNKAD